MAVQVAASHHVLQQDAVAVTHEPDRREGNDRRKKLIIVKIR